MTAGEELLLDVAVRPKPLVSRDTSGSSDVHTVVTDWDELERLAPEWRELWQRASHDYLLTTPEFAEISRRVSPDQRERRLVCVVSRGQQGRLVLIWPFVVYRNHGLRVAVPLSSEWGDYSDVLVEDGPQAQERVRAAWRTLRRACRCDLFGFSFVRASGRLATLIAGECRVKFALHDLEAPEAILGGLTWDAYWASRSARERSGFGRKRRRLQEQGPLAIEEIRDPQRAAPVFDWLIEAKKVWLGKSGKEDKIRLLTNEFRDFLNALATSFMPDGRSELHVLRQGDTILAADLLLIDKARVEWYVGAFHPDYGKYTPGMLLKEHTLQQVIARGLDYDMRLGGGQHKHFWETRVEPTTTWRVANSPAGVGYVLLKNAAKLKSRFNSRPAASTPATDQEAAAPRRTSPPVN